MEKLVVGLNICDDKEKKKVMKTVSGFSGVKSLHVDMKEQKLAVTGDFDPIKMMNKLRKQSWADLVSFGPVDEGDKKKDEVKERKEDPSPAPNPPVYCLEYHPYPYLPLPPEVEVEENPNPCVIS